MSLKKTFIHLADIDIVSKFCKICDRYKDKFDIDVIHGRYIVDGSSILGVTSMTGKIVMVDPVNGEEKDVAEFFKEIKSIGAYKA